MVCGCHLGRDFVVVLILFWISAGSLSTVLLVVAGVVSVSVVGTVGASLLSVSAASPDGMLTLAPGELSI